MTFVVLQNPHHPKSADCGLFPEDPSAGEVLPADVRCDGEE